MTCWLRAAVADSSLLRRWKTRLRFCFTMKLQWFAAVLCLGARAMAGKYSREVNEPRPGGADDEQTVEFRIAKLNQVWEKAKRMQMPPVRQAELHSDLKIQEKDELQWKKLKVEGLDESGEKEAQLRRNFHVILAKYGMDGKRDTRPLESNSLKDHEPKDGDTFEDPRLDKLWNKARNSAKFSDEELANLRREFQHHREKIQEYNLLMDTVSRTEETHKNVIAPLEGDAKEHVLQQKHTELKQKMRDLNHGFERLREISHKGFSEDSGERRTPPNGCSFVLVTVVTLCELHSLPTRCSSSTDVSFVRLSWSKSAGCCGRRSRTDHLISTNLSRVLPCAERGLARDASVLQPVCLHRLLTPLSVSRCLIEFREPRVIELWEAAKRANLSRDELDSLKEELHHFETKVEKHSHYKEQLELSHQKLQHVEALGDREHLRRTQEKYNTLSEKTREMGYKMKKHMQDLSNKISRQGLQHNEL
uniref:Low density lipoprotein receptor-related protein associated protein 1 n=1 Tax=Oryzias latipes TaxID=8090 RepID=A0A3B3HNG6_ORYLA